MKILITGAAGFIGYNLTKKLISEGFEIIGIDNLNDYYDRTLKLNRLSDLGIDIKPNNKEKTLTSLKFSKFSFKILDLTDSLNLEELFKGGGFDVVCNLAAQAGVRYSIENPKAYIDSNIFGFQNIIDNCIKYKIDHLVYASSSSVYGKSTNYPFHEDLQIDVPISLYAATKKSNELVAHTYSHLHNLKTSGLRFFTVYGPWGRPDMALHLFTENILAKKEIKVFNNGQMLRDFTYIDDIVDGISRIIRKKSKVRRNNYEVYNIGSSSPVELLEFIQEIEHYLNIKSIRKYMPIQPGDVPKTYSSISKIKKHYDYNPKTNISTGVSKFLKWYLDYYKVNGITQ